VDYKRIVLAGVVTWVVDSVYGFVVWMKLLGPEFEKYPALFRSQQDMNGKLPIIFGTALLGYMLLAYIYSKGHEGGGVAEGFRFGLLLAVLWTLLVSTGIWATFNVDDGLALKASVATFVEFTLIGTVIGAVYKPPPKGVHATA
jgi:hypothetical protein